MRRFAAAIFALVTLAANAQDQKVMQQGTDFANTLAPTSKNQVVNPGGVNASAWGANTGVSNSVPGNMGTFSAPTSTSATYTQAKSLGLTGLGESALDRCASYKPKGNPVQDQECAAVNFLAQNCMSQSNAEKKVMGNSGAYQPPSADCDGSYGQAQKKFDFTNQITPNDPAFTLTKTAQQNASSQNTQTCTPTTVVTTPAQTEVNKCSKITSTSEVQCSQTLSASLTTTVDAAIAKKSCPQGVMVGDYCQVKSNVPPSPVYTCPVGTDPWNGKCQSTVTIGNATPIYNCTTGYVSGSQCISSQPVNPNISYSCPVPAGGQTYYDSDGIPTYDSFISMTMANYLRYPPNVCYYFIIGNINWNGYLGALESQFGMSPVSWNQDYGRFELAITARSESSCPAGTTQVGNTCFQQVTSTATISGYSCTGGGTVNGDKCQTTQIQDPLVTYVCTNGQPPSNNTCTVITNNPQQTDYSCKDGSPPVNAVCTYHSISASWSDGCSALEKSAGTALGTP